MRYKNEYINILKEELRPAMGCTEPIAIAYAASIAKDALGCLPDEVKIYVSGNILKNVKSVVVPNTFGLRGIKTAVSIGLVAGVKEKELECISLVNAEQRNECIRYMDSAKIEILQSTSDFIFDIHLFIYKDNDVVEVRIVDNHINVVLVRKNDTILLEKEITNAKTISKLTDRSVLSVEEIYNFALEIDLDEVKDLIELQMHDNMAIAEEGLKHSYGANIGKTLLASFPNDVSIKAKAYAAAGSDARMNGCELPVIINSGSGNQGLTCSVPVIVYADELGVSYEKKVRALVLSNLLTTHIKTGIGRLSAYCGAVAAGCAAGAAIAFLHGGDIKMISHTIVNSLAIVSGIICDGAKASCAAKIASSVDAGILGWKLYKEGNQFYAGDGIVVKGVENTIRSVGLLASEGMVETDKEIIKLMLCS